MTEDRAQQLADQAWLKLTARAAMVVFSIIGSLGVPMLVSYFGKISVSIEATREAVTSLREELRVGQAHDLGRINDLDRRVSVLERRADRMEASPPAPSTR
ncbi:hypothetical protein [Microcystis phage Mae-Yong1326-1]|nr:hypothetical protein [Microcystis phage Mae-Yong1326-1]